ncbi:hypothetical protein [Clostridium beijerinckii]|uniref:hypothetical protein n=1 Tax=Clostridium beijerinckii TaxID=1520 RepID=UPI00136114FF|nr:hypothetical protein [Clostridium beijerinckii]MZK53471.1 hypothetical protein [Clostridium beijerinckii]MZK61609.1 hypothetical protein [Clostridium beijerinckii]MZK71834.1 hypothetical protein [Clostridium beijerinckii]MZK77238.1 hypothetical protein [Clostridium beijerinckii]MZK86317.1 hypothetical protein [Clostridium beijerinckii]
MEIRLMGLSINASNPNGGLAVQNETLVKYRGELVYKKCNEQQLENLKKIKAGYMLEIEGYEGVKFEVMKEGTLYGDDSIGFNVKAKEIK